MRDISELDEDANAIKVSIQKSEDHKNSAGYRLRQVREQLQSGEFDKPWTFKLWCELKCEMSVRTAYRLMNIAGPVQKERRKEPQPKPVEMTLSHFNSEPAVDHGHAKQERIDVRAIYEDIVKKLPISDRIKLVQLLLDGMPYGARRVVREWLDGIDRAAA